MNLNIISDLLGIVEEALQNPENKAAVQIARDGIAWWRKVGVMPETLKLEADVYTYGKLVAARHPAQPDRAPLPGEGPQPDVHVGGRPSGTDSGLMRGE